MMELRNPEKIEAESSVVCSDITNDQVGISEETDF